MKLSIIIPTFNSKHFISECIDSIERSMLSKYEIIIIDNNSVDSTVSLIKQSYKGIKLISNHNNLGYSKAINIGFKICKGDFICILNPDTIIKGNAFEVLIKYLENNKNVGCVGPKILNKDETFQYSCRRNFPYIRYLLPKLFLLDKKFPYSKLLNSYNLGYVPTNQITHVNSISGACMLFSKKIYHEVGDFDENFFMFWEDTDYCNRVNKKGYLVSYHNNAEIIHYKGKSRETSDKDLHRIFYESLLYFFIKYRKKYLYWNYFIILPIIGLKFIIKIFSIKASVSTNKAPKTIISSDG